MTEGEQKCPVCAETIKVEAKVCHFCGAQFEVTRRGYCTVDRDVMSVDEHGNCMKCGAPVIDIHTESRLVSDSLSAPAVTEQAAEWVIESIRGEGVNWRFNGYFLDAILIGLIVSVAAVLLAALGSSFEAVMSEADFAAIFSGTTLALIPVIWFFYFFLFETASGATPGKKASYLKVIRKDGGKIAWWQALIRVLFSFIEYNPIGAIVIWITPLKQRIGDLVAGTLVVNCQKIHKLEFHPDRFALEFHDYRRVEFSKISEAVLHKFGLIRQVTLNGISPQGTPITVLWNAQFQRTDLDRIREEIERRYGIFFKEKIILWRLLVVLFTILIGLLTIAAVLVWGFTQ